MLVKNLQWLWNASARVCQHEMGGQQRSLQGMRVFKRKLVFMAKAVPLLESLQGFMYPQANSLMQRAMEQRPEIVGAAIWPYICSDWSARVRLQRTEEHFKAVEVLGAALDFPMNRALLLLDLAEVVPGLKVVLDQPKWFMREGFLVINLFIADTRVYSLAFSFAFDSGRVVAYVGAIQGVDTEGIMDDYKNLTKALQGMRPRDFLVEVFRTFCRCAGVSKIFAISDDKRQHRSRYFKADKIKGFVDYNSIWTERGGVPDGEDFFALALETPMREMEDVPSKKRAMFRRRYELLESIEKQLQDVLANRATSNVIPVPGGASEVQPV